MINKLVEFQKKHPNVYIGGSVSLILQNVIPARVPKDIDIVCPNRVHIYDLFNIDGNKHPLIRRHKHEGLLFELFINPKAQYIEYIYNGDILKLSPVDEIYEWKLRDKNKNKTKHLQDLTYYINNEVN